MQIWFAKRYFRTSKAWQQAGVGKVQWKDHQEQQQTNTPTTYVAGWQLVNLEQWGPALLSSSHTVTDPVLIFTLPCQGHFSFFAIPKILVFYPNSFPMQTVDRWPLNEWMIIWNESEKPWKNCCSENQGKWGRSNILNFDWDLYQRRHYSLGSW